MPGFLLDLMKMAPEPKVLAWISAQTVGDLYLAAVTLGELTRGVVRLPDGRKRDRLNHWITEDLPRQFEDRILSFGRETAVLWGTLMGNGDRMVTPTPLLTLRLRQRHCGMV